MLNYLNKAIRSKPGNCPSASLDGELGYGDSASFDGELGLGESGSLDDELGLTSVRRYS